MNQSNKAGGAICMYSNHYAPNYSQSATYYGCKVSCTEVCRDSAVVRHGLDTCPADYNWDVVGPRSFALKDTVDLCADFTGINAGWVEGGHVCI